MPTQVDYYAVAATMYCLIHGNYMEVIRMPEAGYISLVGTHQSELVIPYSGLYL